MLQLLFLTAKILKTGGRREVDPHTDARLWQQARDKLDFIGFTLIPCVFLEIWYDSQGNTYSRLAIFPEAIAAAKENMQFSSSAYPVNMDYAPGCL
jgi:hypothetical protein